jgi:hypothetical protein
MTAPRTAKDIWLLHAAGRDSIPVEHISSGQIKQLRSRIHETTHGNLAAISGFERFKLNLIASLKLYFLGSFVSKKCDEKVGHVLTRIGNSYAPKCRRCGELICDSEQLSAASIE